ncbi:17624_t:CDS:2 [Racocetra fulgida]|uniref:17624_t:CDS:1 n=1 Tax=Racocetra fulgida TaxID=60492 RepID=A0A9N9F120_9GLOM|nr:17624_t:CDS:2 [Racocetra fulgida]
MIKLFYFKNLKIYNTIQEVIKNWKFDKKLIAILTDNNLITLAIKILIQNLKNITSNNDDNIVQTMQKLFLKNFEEY